MSKEAIYRLITYPSGELEEFEYVQDLVRCKECRHCADDYIDVGMGTMPQFTCEMGIGGDVVSPDDFCSYGEVRDETR